MAHQLDARDNGTASFVSLRQDAWHQLGTIAQDELSFEEAMRLGGLDYSLALRPVTTTVPLFDANGVEYDSLEVDAPARAIVRTDRNEVFGVVGQQYELVTNRAAMGVVEALVGEGLARIEVAGALRGGRDAWMGLRFIGERLDAAGENDGDEIRFYGLVRANHDGKCSVQLATTPTRVVCANTLAMALADGRSAIRSIRHTKSATDRMKEQALSLWGGLVTDAEDMARAFGFLRTREITQAQLTQVLDIVAAVPAAPAPGATDRSKALYAAAVQRAETMRVAVRHMMVNGTGVDGSLSAWNVFNAVTEAIDHGGVAGASRGAAKAEPLVAQLPGGAIATIKHSVWNALLSMVA
jgi:phage/plasmid-like protein (TIGR03299 family)